MKSLIIELKIKRDSLGFCIYILVYICFCLNNCVCRYIDKSVNIIIYSLNINFKTFIFCIQANGECGPLMVHPHLSLMYQYGQMGKFTQSKS